MVYYLKSAMPSSLKMDYHMGGHHHQMHHGLGVSEILSEEHRTTLLYIPAGIALGVLIILYVYAMRQQQMKAEIPKHLQDPEDPAKYSLGKIVGWALFVFVVLVLVMGLYLMFLKD